MVFSFLLSIISFVFFYIVAPLLSLLLLITFIGYFVQRQKQRRDKDEIEKIQFASVNNLINSANSNSSHTNNQNGAMAMLATGSGTMGERERESPLFSSAHTPIPTNNNNANNSTNVSPLSAAHSSASIHTPVSLTHASPHSHHNQSHPLPLPAHQHHHSNSALSLNAAVTHTPGNNAHAATLSQLSPEYAVDSARKSKKGPRLTQSNQSSPQPDVSSKPSKHNRAHSSLPPVSSTHLSLPLPASSFSMSSSSPIASPHEKLGLNGLSRRDRFRLLLNELDEDNENTRVEQINSATQEINSNNNIDDKDQQADKENRFENLRRRLNEFSLSNKLLLPSSSFFFLPSTISPSPSLSNSSFSLSPSTSPSFASSSSPSSPSLSSVDEYSIYLELSQFISLLASFGLLRSQTDFLSHLLAHELNEHRLKPFQVQALEKKIETILQTEKKEKTHQHDENEEKSSEKPFFTLESLQALTSLSIQFREDELNKIFAQMKDLTSPSSSSSSSSASLTKRSRHKLKDFHPLGNLSSGLAFSDEQLVQAHHRFECHSLLKAFRKQLKQQTEVIELLRQEVLDKNEQILKLKLKLRQEKERSQRKENDGIDEENTEKENDDDVEELQREAEEDEKERKYAETVLATESTQTSGDLTNSPQDSSASLSSPTHSTEGEEEETHSGLYAGDRETSDATRKENSRKKKSRLNGKAGNHSAAKSAGKSTSRSTNGLSAGHTADTDSDSEQHSSSSSLRFPAFNGFAAGSHSETTAYRQDDSPPFRKLRGKTRRKHIDEEEPDKLLSQKSRDSSLSQESENDELHNELEEQ